MTDLKRPRDGRDVYADIPKDAERRTYWYVTGSLYSPPATKFEYVKSPEKRWGWACVEHGEHTGWTDYPRPESTWYLSEQEALAHARIRMLGTIASREEDVRLARLALQIIDKREAELAGGDDGH
jgi:hypothetical protein